MRTVILGAGHGGGSVAALLRQARFDGSITLIGDEPLPPYQRPPLSKAWLKGEADGESLLLKPREWYAAHRIDLRLGVRAEALDREAREVRLSDGSTLAYDRLVLALGARARRFAWTGRELPGVLELRTAADADALKAVIGPGRRLLVIGGGYVGLEAAASARALGAAVVVVEREPRLLARVACPELSDFFLRLHRSHGVRFVFDATVEAVVDDGAGRARGVRLTGGEEIEGDAVLVGVGAQPNVELAAAAGLPCDDGVLVDARARTRDPLIHAVGDCTRRPLPFYEREARLESVPSTLEQCRQVVADLTGAPRPAEETPWFWSDQYDCKLQIAGLPYDAVSVVIRGDPSAGRFSVFHLDAGARVRAVEAVNAPADFMGGRQLIGARRAVDPARLADTALSIRLAAA